MAFLSAKEKTDIEIAVKLRREGKITIPGALFELSTEDKVDGLIKNGVLVPVAFDLAIYRGIRIFNIRIVNAVKG